MTLDAGPAEDTPAEPSDADIMREFTVSESDFQPADDAFVEAVFDQFVLADEEAAEVPPESAAVAEAAEDDIAPDATGATEPDRAATRPAKPVLITRRTRPIHRSKARVATRTRRSILPASLLAKHCCRNTKARRVLLCQPPHRPSSPRLPRPTTHCSKPPSALRRQTQRGRGGYAMPACLQSS